MATDPPLGPLIAPAPAGWPAAVAETHSAVVVFLGARAYKVFKPVDLGFLDFTTLAAREEACRREIALNRRIAPDVYLGVLTVTDEEGRVVDHAAVMRRMPAERRLAALLDSDEAPERLREVARLVAAFHAGAERSEEIARAGAQEAVLRAWRENLRQIAPWAGTLLPEEEVEAVGALAERYVAGRGPLFEARRRAGAVCDGHGDLLADDVFCLPDGPRVLDCLAFDDRLRHGDVLADIGFLVMDLERLGHPEHAARLLAWYQEFSGEQHPASLADHYVAYRAHVRSKVACMRHDQGHAPAAEEARLLHRMAHEHLRRGRVRLVLVGGPPGAGKSTLARALAGETGWALVRSDVVRKELAGLAPTDPAPAALGEGLYAPEATERTYDELLRRARVLLGHGVSVVLDASWRSPAHREAAGRLAAESVADLVLLRCEVSEEVALERIARRAREGGDASDATVEVGRALRREGETWGDAVDTSGTPEQAVARALALTA